MPELSKCLTPESSAEDSVDASTPPRDWRWSSASFEAISKNQACRREI